MENNQLPKIDNKPLVKKILAITGATIAFSLILIFFSYGTIPMKGTLIGIGILIVVLPTFMFLGFKYRSNTIVARTKIRKSFLVLGILIVIVNLVLIIIEGGRIHHYLNIILGLYFISGPKQRIKD